MTLIDPRQTGALFYLLAFGMIVRWRAEMYAQFRRLQAAPRATNRCHKVVVSPLVRDLGREEGSRDRATPVATALTRSAASP